MIFKSQAVKDLYNRNMEIPEQKSSKYIWAERSRKIRDDRMSYIKDLDIFEIRDLISKGKQIGDTISSYFKEQISNI